MLIDELLVVGNDRLGDGLSDSVDLGSVSTTGDSDADIDVGEFLKTDNQEGFVDLESEDLWLDKVEGLSVDLDESFTGLVPSCQYFISVVQTPTIVRLVPCSGRRRLLFTIRLALRV